MHLGTSLFFRVRMFHVFIEFIKELQTVVNHLVHRAIFSKSPVTIAIRTVFFILGAIRITPELFF